MRYSLSLLCFSAIVLLACIDVVSAQAAGACPTHSTAATPDSSSACDIANGVWSDSTNTCAAPSGGKLDTACLCDSQYQCSGNQVCASVTLIVSGTTTYKFWTNAGTTSQACYQDPCTTSPVCGGHGTCAPGVYSTRKTCTCDTDWTPASAGPTQCTVAPFTTCPKAYNNQQLGYIVSGCGAGTAVNTTCGVACAAGYQTPNGTAITGAPTCKAAGGVYSPDASLANCGPTYTCKKFAPPAAFKLQDNSPCGQADVYVDQDCEPTLDCVDIYQIPPSGKAICKADGTYDISTLTGCGTGGVTPKLGAASASASLNALVMIALSLVAMLFPTA